MKKKIDLSGKRDTEWKKRIKHEIKKQLTESKIKLSELIKATETKQLEISFPNICAVFKKIEDDCTRLSKN